MACAMPACSSLPKAESRRNSIFQIALGHQVIHLDCSHTSRFGHLLEADGKKAVALKEVAQGALRVIGLLSNAPQSAPARESSKPEVGCRDQPYALVWTVE